MSKDYLPRKLSELAAALRRIVDVTTNHCIGSPPPLKPAWTWISTAELAALKEKVEDLEEAFTRHLEERSVNSKAARDTVLAVTVPLARAFIKKNLTQDLVGIGGREELGLPVRDDVRSPSVPPELPPEGYSIISGEIPAVVRIRYKGGKPKGVISCEIRYGIAEAAPGCPEDLSGCMTFSQNPWMKEFLHDRKKTLYYALRWVVPGNKYSTWSEIKEVVIP